MDLVYGVCQHERDMSGRVRSLHLMCDYYTCRVYIIFTLISLYYWYMYSIYYRVIFSSVIRCIGSTAKYILLHNSSSN